MRKKLNEEREKIQLKRHVNKYCLQGLNRSGAKTQEGKEAGKERKDSITKEI